MKGCESKPRKAIAATIDFYYFAIAVGFLASLAVSVARLNFLPPFYALLFLPVDLAIVVTYHAAISSRVGFLTLGETIAGRIREHGKKIWANPYCRNRGGILAFIFIVLIIYGNSFDSVFDGSVPSTTATLLAGTRILLATLGFLLMGKGNIGGILFPTALLALGSLISTLQPLASPSGTIVVAGGIILGLAGLVIWLVYRRPIPSMGEDEDHTHGGH